MSKRSEVLFLLVGILVSALFLSPKLAFCGDPTGWDYRSQASEDSTEKKQPQQDGLPVTIREPKLPGERWLGTYNRRQRINNHIRGKWVFDEAQAAYENARTKADLDEAVEKFREAKEVAESVGAQEYAYGAAMWQSKMELEKGRPDRALEILKRSLKNARGAGMTSTEAGATNLLGRAYKGMGQYDKAEELFKTSLDLAVKSNDLGRQGQALVSLGEMDALKGNPSEALEKYQRAAELSENAGDTQGIGIALQGSGKTYLSLGQYDKATENFQKAAEISERSGSVRDRARAHEQLGRVYQSSGRNSQAIEHLRKGIEQAEKAGDLKQVTEDLYTLGLLHLNRGQYNKAAEAFQQGLEKAKKTKNIRLEGESLRGLGRIYNILGNYPKALENLQGSVEIARKSGKKKEEAESLTFLGQSFFKWGKHGQATELFEQALNTAKRAGDKKGESEALIQLGLLYQSIGEQQKALETLSRARDISKGNAATSKKIDDLIANLYLDLGDLQKAEPLITKSGSEQSKGRLSLLKKDYSKAVSRYEKLAQDAEKSGNVDDFFTAYTGRGLAQEGLGDFESAAKSFRKAVESVEETRSTLSVPERSEFFNVRIGGFMRTAPYEGIARVSVKMNKPVDALRESELVKARGFSEAISRRVEGVFQDIPEEIMEKDLEVNEHLAALLKRRQIAYEKGEKQVIRTLEPQIEKAKADLEANIEKLRSEYPLFAATKYPSAMDLSKTALRPDEWTLVYNVTDDGVLIYLTHGQELIKGLFKVMPRQELEKLVRKFMTPLKVVAGQDDLVEKLKAFDFESSKKLADLLTGDVLPVVPEGVTIVLSPDGCLGSLPFEMLTLNGEGRVEEGAGLPQITRAKFFGDRNPVVYCQSITALTLTRTLANQAKPEDRLLVIADPVFDTKDARLGKPSTRTAAGGGVKHVYRLMNAAKRAGKEGLEINRLPLTGELADALKEMYEDKSDVYTGLKASKEVFFTTICPSLANYGSILFATHGYLDSSSHGITEPLLVLSMVPLGTDGFLRASEVMGLKLNAGTVVLGACQTGLGRQVPGEGTMGMGRSFQYAGARSVLMSLWSVAERSSVKLVEDFFRYVKGGKGSLEALRLARSDIRKDGYDHPFFWAPFILVGEAR
jgi:tetratricopeptide (TPR) repeat protein